MRITVVVAIKNSKGDDPGFLERASVLQVRDIDVEHRIDWKCSAKASKWSMGWVCRCFVSRAQIGSIFVNAMSKNPSVSIFKNSGFNSTESEVQIVQLNGELLEMKMGNTCLRNQAICLQNRV